MNPELKSGSTLGHYELLTRLGRGGMASVWVARERAPVSGRQRLVALKAMLPELARHSDFRAMFLEEGQIVRSIDHPHVVKVHEVSEDHGILYMAMDWVEGDSLRTLIKEARRRRAIPAEMAVKIIADTAAGLHAAHELRGWDGELRNIVHCDVSPHNILVGLDGQAKLVDFGVANATAHSAIDSEDKIKGKFGYMSPEQASAGKVDRRSDVFALGIVLFELTTGERLFRGDDAAHTLELVKNGRIPTPNELYAKYPEALAAIVGRALARNSDERFQTAAEFREALEQYLKDERILVSHAGVGQLVRRVLGPRIEQQRQALREALTVADGSVVSGLVPDQPAALDRSASGVSSALLPSEPPTGSSSTSQFSSSRSSTPHAQTIARNPAPQPGFLPLFAALAGLAAAAAAIFWVTHRPGPAPLITTQRTERATPRHVVRDDSVDPVGVNVDSLPTASQPTPALSRAAEIRAALIARNSATMRALSAAHAARDTAAAQGGSAESRSLPEAAAAPDAVREPSVGRAPVVSPTPAAGRSAAPVAPDQRSPLNRGAALATLGSAASVAAACKQPDGPSGGGSVSVTFSPDGPVKSVTVSAPFANTAVGQCVTTAFRKAQVPPFSGSSVTLSKSFQIPR